MHKCIHACEHVKEMQDIMMFIVHVNAESYRLSCKQYIYCDASNNSIGFKRQLHQSHDNKSVLYSLFS